MPTPSASLWRSASREAASTSPALASASSADSGCLREALEDIADIYRRWIGGGDSSARALAADAAAVITQRSRARGRSGDRDSVARPARDYLTSVTDPFAEWWR